MEVHTCGWRRRERVDMCMGQRTEREKQGVKKEDGAVERQRGFRTRQKFMVKIYEKISNPRPELCILT